jgi:hypothetical protein
VNASSSVIAVSVEEGLRWRADVNARTVKRMCGNADYLAVKRPGAKFCWLWAWVDDE